MKMFFATVTSALLVALFCATAYADDSIFFGVNPDNIAGDLIKPQSNTEELVGKVISFTDETNSQKNVWHFSIIGSSEHVMSMHKDVILYVGAVNYLGYQVKQIFYCTDGARGRWQIEYYIPAGFLEPESRRNGYLGEKSEKIQVISIK